MSLTKASIWTAISILIKIGTGLIIIKLLAISFGPIGVGQIGNFRQLIIILGILSGAGIYNGVTKYVAEYHQIPTKLSALLGTSSSIILGFSTILAIIFLFFSSFISFTLFGHIQYKMVICALGLIQIVIAYANYFLAILKGFRDAKSNALSISIGSLIGIIIYYFFFKLSDYKGFLIILTLIPALIIVPSGVFILRYKKLYLSYFKPCWNIAIVYNLTKFTLMTLITLVTLPIAYIIIRNLLINQYGWNEVGIWQGISNISDIYLQFITISFNVYLLPTLAKLKHEDKISVEIFKTLKLVLPIIIIVSIIIWLLRDFIILLIFSDKFILMRNLFAWQLIGDVLKISSYIFGYLVIAKGALHFYILMEVIQFILLIGFAYYLIPTSGALGASKAYMTTYIIYFMLCSSVFYIYKRKK
ncbi:MAG: lipid III flippase WzxE [Arsenophonus sp. ET-YP4-MAG3]